MRKNFLILMLMALLPLAGWAQTASFGEMALGKYTYGGEDYNALPVPTVKDSQSSILTEGTHYTVTEGVFTDEACTKKITVANLKTMKADGTTKYWRQVVGKTGTAYEGQTKSAYFYVDKASVTLTYTGSLNRTYGDDPVELDPTKFSAAGLKYSQEWGTGTADDVRKGSAPTSYSTANNNAGTNKAVTFVGGWTADNYEITYDVKLDITPKPLTITDLEITANQGDVVYNGNQVTGVYTVKYGDVTLTTNDYTVSKVGPNASATAYVPTITPKGNYSGSAMNVDAISGGQGFKITPAPISVSINDLEVTYTGADQAVQTSNSELEYSYSGIVAADITNAATIKSSFSTTGATVTVDGEAIDAGEYALVVAGVTTGTSTNYEIKDYLPATLTIKPIELSIIAKAETKKYGAADPAFKLATDTPTGILTGYKVSGVTFTREDGEEVGTYDITPNVSAAKVKKDDTDDTKNYTFKIATPKAQLTIEQGAITVTIKDAEKFYGEADPTEFEYVVTGLQDDDELGAVTIVRADANKVAGQAVGSYALTATAPANPDATKYTGVTVVPGIFTINKARLVFDIPAQNVATGATAADLKKDGITVTGINNSDKAADLYTLAFESSVATTGNNTYDTGIEATLTTTAAASYVIWDATTKAEITKATGKLIVGDGTVAAQNYTSVDADFTSIKNHAGEKQNVKIQFAPRNGRNYGSGDGLSWQAGKWTTMVLPFDISVAKLSATLGYAIVNVIDPSKTVVSGTTSEFHGKLTMKGGNGSDEVLKANKPFLIKLAEDIDPTKAYDFGAQTLVAPDDLSVDAGEGAKFVGTYTKKTVTKNDDAAIWFMNGDENGWQYINTTSSATWSIVPFEAYIDMSTSSAPRNIIFYAEEIDGSVTAIKGISTDVAGVKKSAEGWYTINGVKLQAAPSQKGIYILNGKKYVVK